MPPPVPSHRPHLSCPRAVSYAHLSSAPPHSGLHAAGATSPRRCPPGLAEPWGLGGDGPPWGSGAGVPSECRRPGTRARGPLRRGCCDQVARPPLCPAPTPAIPPSGALPLWRRAQLGPHLPCGGVFDGELGVRGRGRETQPGRAGQGWQREGSLCLRVRDRESFCFLGNKGRALACPLRCPQAPPRLAQRSCEAGLGRVRE